MHVDPKLNALRSDPASQRQLQEQVASAQAQWRGQASVAAVLNELAQYGDGAQLSDLPELSRVIEDAAFASEWIGCWTRHWVQCLKANPLALIPMRHHRSQAFSNLQIEARGRAALSLAVYEKRETKLEPFSVVFSESDQREIVLVGSAQGFTHKIIEDKGNHASIESEARIWSCGDTIITEGRKSWRQIIQADGHMLMLQLTRAAPNPAPTREFCLTSGALLRQSSGEKALSQQELAMAVLGALDRRDAAPVVAELARSGPDHRRWEAVRQTLGLDPVAGFALLQDIADNPADSLCGHARSVRAQLLAEHPQLNATNNSKEALCPA